MARILLLDDHPELLRAIKSVLASAGLAVDAAETIAQARALLDAHDYAAAILDVSLPDGDGLALLEWMRTTGRRTGVLVITGEPDRALTSRAVELHASLAFKPVSAAALLSFVSALEVSAGRPLAAVARAFAIERALTPRQTELLQCIADGVPRAGLAAALGTSENRVKALVRPVLSKASVSSVEQLRSLLLSEALERGAE